MKIGISNGRALARSDQWPNAEAERRIAERCICRSNVLVGLVERFVLMAERFVLMAEFFVLMVKR